MTLMAKYVLLGIGNRMKGDDGAGSVLAERFADTVKNDNEWASIDGNVLPENYTSVIKREAPEKLFIVDVCDIDGDAGDYRYVKVDELVEDYQFNTHSAPIKVFIDYLNTFTKEVIMIGIQPKNISMFSGISSEVEQSINEIMDIFKNRDFSKIRH